MEGKSLLVEIKVWGNGCWIVVQRDTIRVMTRLKFRQWMRENREVDQKGDIGCWRAKTLRETMICLWRCGTVVTLEGNVGERAHLRFQEEANSREPDFSYSIDGGESLRRGRGCRGFCFFFPIRGKKTPLERREKQGIYSLDSVQRSFPADPGGWEEWAFQAFKEKLATACIKHVSKSIGSR